jgi:hypothetical protein
MGRKIEVSSLPPSRSPIGGGRDDLSAGQTADVSGLLDEDIKDRKRLRTFQTVAFYGACTLIFFVFCAMFHWVNLVGTHIQDVNVTTTYRVSFFVGPIVVLASLGALLTLALLKFAFRATDKGEDDASPISLMHALGTQALDVLKTYLGGKGKGGGE